MRMHRLAAAAAIGGLALPLAATTAQASTVWAPTATGAPTAALWSGLSEGGPVAPGTTVTVTLALPLRDPAAVAASIAARRIGTPATFDADYAPTQATADAVVGYLSAAGFHAIDVSPDRMLVTATADAAAAGAAFDTSIVSATFAGKRYYANTSAASVPASLTGSVTAVLGLTDLPVLHLDAAPASTCAGTDPTGTVTLGALCTIEPPDYQSTYDAKGTPTGATTPIAIFGEGVLTQVATDYTQERRDLGLPSVAFNVIQPSADSTAQTDTSGADEFDLDTQSSTGMAQDVGRLDVYDASSLATGPTTDDFDAFTQPVGGVLDKAGSASYGGCESLAYALGETAADDPIFMKAAYQGQTIFASSGDTGSACRGVVNGVPAAGVPGVEYPASAEYVVGVGGTSLFADPTTFAYQQEIAWAGGGGGYSTFEPQPSWQASETSPYGTTGSALGVKTVPDISNVADPNNGGAWVDVAGTYEGVGGTSLASPLSLGEWARVESDYGDSLGFAAPIFYALAGTPAFHDITLGNTGIYEATPGYDLATGIGTPDVAQMEKLIGTDNLEAVGTLGAAPPSSLPESPLAVALPIAGLIGVGWAWRMQRRRRTPAATGA